MSLDTPVFLDMQRYGTAHPVSYTHLDVYKRQQLHIGGSQTEKGRGNTFRDISSD